MTYFYHNLLFLGHNFKQLFLKMNEFRPVKTYSDLSTLSLNDQTKFRLNEINKIKDYFNSEIQERETISKKLSKSIASLDYMDKVLIVCVYVCVCVCVCVFPFTVKASPD